MARPRSLAGALSGKPWLRGTSPFPHYVTTELFKPDVADAISDEVRAAVAEPEKLYSFGYFDATSETLTRHREWPLGLFTSREWLELVAGVVGMDVLPHLSGSIHHHEIASLSGSVHADFNPAYFVKAAPEDGVVLAQDDKVAYMTGAVYQRGVKVEQVVRAVSILYYAGNDDWQPGDGGETGIYLRQSDPVHRPALAIPPRNNTLLVFECTPYSFHSFITNSLKTRNAIVMWLHRSFDDATSSWSEAQLEMWN